MIGRPDWKPPTNHRLCLEHDDFGSTYPKITKLDRPNALERESDIRSDQIDCAARGRDGFLPGHELASRSGRPIAAVYNHQTSVFWLMRLIVAGHGAC